MWRLVLGCQRGDERPAGCLVEGGAKGGSLPPLLFLGRADDSRADVLWRSSGQRRRGLVCRDAIDEGRRRRGAGGAKTARDAGQTVGSGDRGQQVAKRSGAALDSGTAREGGAARFLGN